MNKIQVRICSMTKEDFANLPRLGDEGFKGFDPNKDSFGSVVIIPTGEMHDSGYQCMEFALINDKGMAICKVGGYSDVINIDGIGGYGTNGISKAFRLNNGQSVVVPHGWNIDCLPCGYLRLFVSSGYSLILERPYWNGSNFEVYAEEKEK
jgi:hypothetical protein